MSGAAGDGGLMQTWEFSSKRTGMRYDTSGTTGVREGKASDAGPHGLGLRRCVHSLHRKRREGVTGAGEKLEEVSQEWGNYNLLDGPAGRRYDVGIIRRMRRKFM